MFRIHNVLRFVIISNGASEWVWVEQLVSLAQEIASFSSARYASNFCFVNSDLFVVMICQVNVVESNTIL